MAGSRPRFCIASRSKGHRVCAMAAYRSGDRITDHAYHCIHNYSRKKGVLHSVILAPAHAPQWAYNRVHLWNAVERSELTKAGTLKKGAQLARDIMVPLAHELDHETNKAALHAWVKRNFVDQGMIADVSIHAPHEQGDQRNYHAHILLTLREITPRGFHEKKTTPQARSWNKKALLERSIKDWEKIQNNALEHHGFETRVNFDSFEKQSIEREPDQHIGPRATALHRKGQKTRILAENIARQNRNTDRAHGQAATILSKTHVSEEDSHALQQIEAECTALKKTPVYRRISWRMA